MKAQDHKTVLKQELKTICQELQEKMNVINEHESVEEGHPNTR
ncbi:MAG TPA: hypothetical protein VJ964_02430 [Balneolaceae bacterium]|nr:hypothetical protein [Balneolaceae bacterium]